MANIQASTSAMLQVNMFSASPDSVEMQATQNLSTIIKGNLQLLTKIMTHTVKTVHQYSKEAGGMANALKFI